MLMVIESFNAAGNDGNTYKVNLLEHPGPEHKPLNGPRRRMRGRREYRLSDGTELIDVSEGVWEIVNTSVKITKIEDPLAEKEED